MGTLKEGTQGQHEQRAVGVIRDGKVGMVGSGGDGKEIVPEHKCWSGQLCWRFGQ